jgi:dihydrodipicolinate synthase/N-acetylneuraminate lyase
MKKLYGVVTALTTPIDKNGKIIKSSVFKLVDYIVKNGVNCLYPMGSTGEMFFIDKNERKKMAEYVIEANSGRAVVYIHVGAKTLKETIELASHAYDSGADGIAAVTPVYYKVNDEEMYDYYSAIAKSIPENFPLYIYNIPQLSSNDISVSICEKLAKTHSNIIGIKYSYPDMLRTREYIQVNDSNFSVLHGCDTLFDTILTLGCTGTVSGISCVFPNLFAHVYKAFMNRDIESMMSAQRKVNEVSRVILDGSSIANLKAALILLGIDMGYMIRPLHESDAASVGRIKSLLYAEKML